MTNPDLFSTSTLLWDIQSQDQSLAWSQSQHYADPATRWRAYLNHLCWLTLQVGLASDLPQLKSRFSLPSMQTRWEFVDGVAFRQGAADFVFFPSENIDQESFSIPQEWIDISDWAAHYYCPVEVNLEEGYMALSGATSHGAIQNLRLGSDRTYDIDYELLQDWAAITVALELGITPASPETETIAALSISQAQALINRLGKSELSFPRLEIPIPQWNALMTHGGWRQSLAEKRWNISQPRSLSAWLQNGVSDWFENLGWSQLRSSELSGARGEEQQTESLCSRALEIEGEPFELVIRSLPNQNLGFRFELRSAKPSGLVPQGYRLTLLTADLGAFENNEAIATQPMDGLQVDVLLAPEDVIVWEVSPKPEDFEYECFTA